LPTAVAPPVYFLPRWARIATACLMFADTVVHLTDGFLRFEWLPSLCFGLYFLIYEPRQKWETARAWFSKPRSIASLALLIIAICGFGHYLYVLFKR